MLISLTVPSSSRYIDLTPLSKHGADCRHIKTLTRSGHETVGIVAGIGSKVKTLKIGDRAVADNSEFCGECFYCRRGDELFCENLHAHGVTMSGGFAEYCSYPGMNNLALSLYSVDLRQLVRCSRSRTSAMLTPPSLNPLLVPPTVLIRSLPKWAPALFYSVLTPPVWYVHCRMH